MTPILHGLLAVLAAPAVLASLYLLVLTLLSGAPAVPRRSSRSWRFDVVVPAHDEAPIIEAVVANLLRLDWPADGFRVIVVADNCADATAARARAAGATVIERDEPGRRGKGHALELAFRTSAAERWADAVVVVDADSQASPNLLEAFASRLERGARAVQAHYGVLNAQASWRTRLMAIALGAFHRVRSRGRERLGLSCGLRGNGWCVTHELLRRVPHRAYSLAEDIEYGIALGLAGVRVQHADEARVDAAMVSGEAAAQSQRRRWESGRWQLLRTLIGPLLRAALLRPSAVCLDLAADLLVPPLSWLVLAVVALMGLSLAGLGWQPAMGVWLAVASGCALALTLYVARGWQLSGVGRRGLADLRHVPSFLLWKLLLVLRARGPAEWVRTLREKP